MAVLFLFLLSAFFRSVAFSLNITSCEKLLLPSGVTSPISLTFNTLGEGPYTGISDGRILKYNKLTQTFLNFSYTNPNRSSAFCDGTSDPNKSPICGMAYALGFNTLTSELYATDPFYGVGAVGPFGGPPNIIVPTNNGVPYYFLSAIDVDIFGVPRFTDASLTYGPRDIPKRPFPPGESTGRLFELNPITKKVTTLLTGISGAVGVATDIAAKFALISEATANRIRKFYLQGEKAGTSEILVNLPGSPNKIKRNEAGDFWIAVNIFNQNETTFTPRGIKINSTGDILAIVDLSQDYNQKIVVIVQENGGKLYVGARNFTYVCSYDIVC